MNNVQKVINPYFGKWGGFFVPDPMTPGLDDFASLAEKIVVQDDFRSQIETLLAGIVEPEDLKPVPNSKNIYSLKTSVLYYVAAGYALLAKASGKQLVCGVYSPAQASILAAVCKKLSHPLGLWLNVATGADEKLVGDLGAQGVQVNLDLCRTLFDEPDMYAFQKFVADPGRHLWASLNTVTGACPFPALTAFFAHFYTDKVLEAAGKLAGEKSVKFAATGYPGFSMAGLITGAGGEKLNLVTYEPPIDREREDCYLGAYTKVAMIGKNEFVLSPQVVDAWERGVVDRVFTCAPLQYFAGKNDPNVIVVLED